MPLTPKGYCDAIRESLFAGYLEGRNAPNAERLL